MLQSRQVLGRHVALRGWRGTWTRNGSISNTLRPRYTSSTSTNSSSTTTTTTAASGKPASKDGSVAGMSVIRQFGLYGSLAIVLVMSFYGAQVAIALNKAGHDDEPDSLDLSTQKDVAARYDQIANSFDSDVNFSEWLMGILSLRKLLARMCHGNVLEVSCGTGRNLGYFQFDEVKDEAPALKSLTFLDISEPMVQVCRRKWAALYSYKSVQTGYWKKRPVRFIATSALDDMPLAPDGNRYDTILQTMGLCSTPVPEDLLRNMARHLNLDNPDARILLLEHGRSTQPWLNRVLDTTAEKHAEIYGCWYNRDIDAIVRHAAERAGLELVESKRVHLGTTFVYELKAGDKLLQTPGKSQKQASGKEDDSGVYRAWQQLFGK